MKKLISIFLSLVMALSVCSVAFVSNAQTIAQPLKYDYTLEKIAMQRACELVYLYEHKRPNGSSVFTTYSDYGYNSNGKGENIAKITYESKNDEPQNIVDNAAKVHETWREDNEHYAGQGHRRAMLDPRYTAVGIAHIYYFDGAKYIHFWAEEFGTTVSNTNATAANDSNASVSLMSDNSVVVSNLTPNITSTSVKTSVNVKFEQTNARTVLAMINNFRASKDAWYWNSDNVTKTYVNGYQEPTKTVVNSVTPNGNSSSSTSTLKSASKPKKPTIKSLKKGKKSFILKWKKIKDVKGYQVQYSTSKKFKKAKKVNIKKSSTTKLTVKKLKKKKKYYVRMRSYKMVNGKKVYSSWSKTKTVKTK